MKDISNITAILGLCVIMLINAAPTDINTGSDKEKDTNISINAKVF